MATDTRTRILQAARDLVESEGAATPMGRIAEQAGVSRRALYLHFESRTDLLLSLVAYVDETGNLIERAKEVTRADNPVDALDALVSLNADYNPEIHRIARALERERDTDKAAAMAWDDRMEGRRALCRWISRRLAEDDLLVEGASIATSADLIWSLTNTPLWRELVVERGWSSDRYRRWVTRLLHNALLKPSEAQ